MSLQLQNAKEQFDREVAGLRGIQKELQKSIESRTTLTQQLTENQMVKKELDMLEEGARVFKLVGPVLIRQDHAEASANVNKRIDLITKETERVDGVIRGLEGRVQEKQKELRKMQGRVMEIQQQMTRAQ